MSLWTCGDTCLGNNWRRFTFHIIKVQFVWSSETSDKYREKAGTRFEDARRYWWSIFSLCYCYPTSKAGETATTDVVLIHCLPVSLDLVLKRFTFSYFCREPEFASLASQWKARLVCRYLHREYLVNEPRDSRLTVDLSHSQHLNSHTSFIHRLLTNNYC